MSLITIKFRIDLHTFVRLSGLVLIAYGKAIPGGRNVYSGFKYGKNIGSSCTLVGVENGPNRSKDKKKMEFLLVTNKPQQ